MPFASRKELERFVADFESCNLTHEEWTHAAHVSVAAWYVHSDPELALERIREGILRLNAAQGVVTTMERGYHETITRAWVCLLRDLATRQPTLDCHELANLAAETYADKRTLLTYYSRELIMSPEARFGWVEPDLLPLPEIARQIGHK